MVAVRFRSPAPLSDASLGASVEQENLFPVCFPAHIAQSVEHFLGKEEVTGSNPVVGSTGSALLHQSGAEIGTH
jgi:hypothetical protein